VLFNTTNKDLQFTKIPGSNHVVPTGFDGAGKDRTKGRAAALQVKADISASLQSRFKTVDFIFVLTSAGGGSGSGSAPVLADTAVQYFVQQGIDKDEAVKRVGFIVMLPTLSDGSAVLSNAGQMLAEITDNGKSKYGPIMLIDNQRIKTMSRGSLADWQEKSNTLAARLFSVFNSFAARDSRLSTFDPMDYTSVLTSGILTIGMNVLPQGLETEMSISNSISKNLKGNLLVDGLDLSTGTHAAVVIVSDEKNLSLEYSEKALENGQKTILSIMGNSDTKRVVLHRGVYSSTTPGVFVYSIIGGLTIPAQKMKSYGN
jgi:cell division GTPase FtsZ